MRKSTRVWIGIGVFVMAGSGYTALASTPKALTLAGADAAVKGAAESDMHRAQPVRLAQAKPGGEGGEGGGEGGGEAGINIAKAENDAVEYNIALQVIAAHYYAGLAAYEVKQTEAGAQLFAHGLSEVYVEMEDVFRKRGVDGLGKALEAAVEAATEKKPVVEVRARVDAVLKAVAAAVKTAPKTAIPEQAVTASAAASMLARAAAQYPAALKDKNLESYLDGYGFAVAGREQAKSILPWLRKTDKKKAAALAMALKLADAAYVSVTPPRKPRVKTAEFLAATSAAELAMSRW